jgi:hypothetical protein
VTASGSTKPPPDKESNDCTNQNHPTAGDYLAANGEESVTASGEICRPSAGKSKRPLTREQDADFEVVRRLFPPVGGIPIMAERTDAVDIPGLHDAVRRLSADTPILITVDDCQWVDRPSLQWLTALSWRARQMPVLVMVSVGEGEPCVDDALLEELHASSVTEIRPGVLSPPAAARILETILGVTPEPLFVSACLDNTRGNPLLLTALARSLAEHRVAPTAVQIARVAEVDPPGLAPALRTKLRRTSPHAFAAVQAVAVLAANATIGRVSDMIGVEASALAETLAALQRLGLLHITGSRIGLVHPALQTLLERQLSYCGIRTMHAQAARLLHEHGLPRAKVADHLLAAEPIAESWALAVLRIAAHEALESGAPDQAVAYLRRALAEPLSPDDQVDVTVALANAESRTDIMSAIEHLSSVISYQAPNAAGVQAAEQLMEVLALAGSGSPHDHSCSADNSWMSGESTSMNDPGRANLPEALNISVAELRLAHPDTTESAIRRIAQLQTHAGASDAFDTPARVLLTSLACQIDTWAGRARADVVGRAERIFDIPLTSPSDIRACLRAALVLADSGLLDVAHRHISSVIARADRWQQARTRGGVFSTIGRQAAPRLADGRSSRRPRRACTAARVPPGPLDRSGTAPTGPTHRGAHRSRPLRGGGRDPHDVGVVGRIARDAGGRRIAVRAGPAHHRGGSACQGGSRPGRSWRAARCPADQQPGRVAVAIRSG